MGGTKVSTSALDVNAQEFVPAALNKKEVASSSEAINNIEDGEEEEEDIGDEDEDLDDADPEIEEDPENDFVIIDKNEIIPGIQVPTSAVADSTNRATEEDSTTTTPSSSDEASSTDVGFSR